ncbi:hypothetical protein AX16_007918, partial [Volvariella volvacea WC 439]
MNCVPTTSTGTPPPTTTTTTTSNPPASTGTYRNPIKEPNGSDPFMVYSNGYYYLTTTTWSNLQITRATSINGLKTATPKVVWTDSTSSRCCNMWAPEIHWQPREGAWYIYYSAGTSGTFDNQRVHAIKGSSSDLWASTWSYAGRVVPPNRDVGFIDGTVLVVNNNRYLVFSSWDSPGQRILYSQMTSAVTVGNATRISCPTLSWEREGAAVQEGPAGLYHNGRTWIVYSASLCSGTGYKLGRLELTGSNPLLESAWTKYGSPIFQSANG